ncbi:MAG: type III secretion system export apparatus subunit SctR [Myxococcales bacterium]|nr:type III secretion system export apparatus subunit SctR [Myxococcales bacterium]MCB9644538.1 type III secretion system export apparatus subunit SctR [Myxococcales bacterium]
MVVNNPKTKRNPNLRLQRILRPLIFALCASLPFILFASDALAKRKRNIAGGATIDFSDSVAGNPLVLVVVMGTLALVPFLLIMITSFVKIAVVLSIVRSALGTQQNPPTQVITGLSIILTVYVMVPVGLEIRDELQDMIQQAPKGQQNVLSTATVSTILKAADKAQGPIRRFLLKHSHLKDRNMFYNLALQLRKEKHRASLTPTDFTVVVPSFVISELKEAFQIGFLLFLPFIVVDMVVANILLALGMHMLSPTTISLPFKLLLFVLVDGWYLIIKGLILGYL